MSDTGQFEELNFMLYPNECEAEQHSEPYNDKTHNSDSTKMNQEKHEVKDSIPAFYSSLKSLKSSDKEGC